MSEYHINLFYSDEDRCWIADIPDLRCSAFGDTPEDALAAITTARKLWIETANESGKPIPAPRYRPAIYQAV